MKPVIETIEVVTFSNLKRAPIANLSIHSIFSAADAQANKTGEKRRCNAVCQYPVICEEIAAEEAALREWVRLTDPIVRRLKAEEAAGNAPVEIPF
jgi:hypothetical protein